MAIKRSPRYPRHTISKSLTRIEKFFRGAHQTLIDVDAAPTVLGYTNSSSGAAAGALGALRQYGLVDGLRGDLRVSDLAMRIIQPMDTAEKLEALAEAAMKPEIFGKVVSQFGGSLPPSDEPIKAYLIRQGGFSAGGAKDLIDALRGTLADIDAMAARDQAPSAVTEDLVGHDEVGEPLGVIRPNSTVSSTLSSVPARPDEGELIVLPLGANCRAELRFVGSVTETAYSRLIRHLELLKEALGE